MSRQIKFFDTTLRDGEQTPGVTLTTKEKVQIARQLEKLRVDVIEAGFAVSSHGDFDAVQSVAAAVGPAVTVASLARAVKGDIDAAWEALKQAKSPRIHTFIATSDVHMQYKLKMTREQVLEATAESVRYAKKFCENVEFSAEDASRTDREFLYRVIQAAVDAGATVVNIPDTVGYTTPWEYCDLIRSVREHVSGIEKAEISVHCHNDLGLATANSLAAIVGGATQIECTINGLGERAGNASMEEIAMGITTRKDFYNVSHNLKADEFFRTSRLVCNLSGVDVQPHKAIVGANAFAHASGIHQHGMLANKSTYEIMTPESVGVSATKMVLGKLSGKHAFLNKLQEMGYNPSDDELESAFVRFKDLCDHKKNVTDADIEALISETTTKASARFEIDSYQIASGNRMMSTATVTLKDKGELKTEAATGEGPVEAAFHAINRLVGSDFSLDSYALKAVTEGSDALGEVTVRIHNGKPYVGRGVATDIIEASIRAYINAVNRAFSE